VLAAGLVTVAAQSRVAPYVVEVDKLGRAQAFGPAEPLRVTDQRVAIAQIAGFIRDIRMVLADPTAQSELVRHAYAYVDQGAADFLNTYFANPANDPRVLGHDFTRIVEVTGVLPVPGSASGQQTWKVSWTETSIPRAAGGESTIAAWEGYLTTRVVPPSTTERITLNPLGLYITSVNWTQLATRPARPESDTPPVASGVTP
jgi:type IV secretion system protein VirB5